MRRAQQIVARIKGFLEAGLEIDPAGLASLSEEYAGLCDKANETLRRCEQYLRNGMRTEAIHLAEATPPILEVAAILDFHGVEAWREFCRRDDRFTVPSPIAAEVVSWLNQAYVQEDSLTEVLAEYRRIAHHGTLPQKIFRLRRLAELDAQNAPHWREDLKRFEEARLGQLAEAARRLIGADNLQGMESLLDEIRSPDWLAKPDARLVAELERHIERVRVQEAQAQGKQIAQEAWEAYGALDYDLTGAAIGKWRNLIAEGIFEPSSDLDRDMAEVQEWFNIEKKKRTEEQEFNYALSALSDALDKGVARDELERRLFAVTKHDREVPETLLRRAQLAIEDARKAEERTRKLVMAAGGVLLLIIAAVVVLLVRSAIVKRHRVECRRRLLPLVEAEAYEEASKVFDDREKQHPEIAREAEFQDIKFRIERGLVKLRVAREAFEVTSKEMDKIRAGGFRQPTEERSEEPPKEVPKSVCEDYVRRIEALAWALTPAQKVRYQRWVLDWKKEVARREAKIDEKFDALIDLVDTGFATLNRLGLNDEEQRSQYLELLIEGQNYLEAADKMTGHSETLRMEIRRVRAEWGEYYAKHEKFMDELRQKKQLLRLIQSALPDLAEYERRLRRFAEAFPNDAETARFRKLIADCALGMDLERGAQSAALAGTRSIWRDSLVWSRAQVGTAERVARAKNTMLGLRDNIKLYSLRHLYATEDTDGKLRIVPANEKAQEHLRYYFVGDPEFVSQTGTPGRFQCNYLINVLKDGDEPTQEAFYSKSRLPTDPEAMRAPHCKWLRRVFRQILNAEDKDCEAVLLQGLEELRTDSESEPVARALLMLALLEVAKDLNPGNAAEIGQLLKHFEHVTTDVLWYNPKSDDTVREARLDSEDALEKMTALSDMLRRAKAANRIHLIHAIALSRNVRCVGRVTQENGKFSMDLRGPRPPEVWIISGKPREPPAIYIAAVADANGALKIRPEVQARLHRGQPLFAPTRPNRPAETTSEILKMILKDIPADQLPVLDGLSWPASWPVNGRKLTPTDRGPSNAE